MQKIQFSLSQQLREFICLSVVPTVYSQRNLAALTLQGDIYYLKRVVLAVYRDSNKANFNSTNTLSLPADDDEQE